MGVYIFQISGTNWIKIGHHLVTTKRPNAYFRVARRGFHSCKHPQEIEHKLDVENLLLLRWYPLLTKREERLAHRRCLVSHGEFHAISDLPAAVACLDAHGTSVEVSSQDRDDALRWAKKLFLRKTPSEATKREEHGKSGTP